MRQAGLTPRRDLDPRFISSPGGGNRPNDVRPRLQDISRIVDPAAVHVPADGAINRHRGSPEGDRGIARVSPRRDLVAVACTWGNDLKLTPAAIRRRLTRRRLIRRPTLLRPLDVLRRPHNR